MITRQIAIETAKKLYNNGQTTKQIQKALEELGYRSQLTGKPLSPGGANALARADINKKPAAIRRRLTTSQVNQVKSMLRNGDNYAAIKKNVGVSHGTIWRISKSTRRSPIARSTVIAAQAAPLTAGDTTTGNRKDVEAIFELIADMVFERIAKRFFTLQGRQ